MLYLGYLEQIRFEWRIYYERNEMLKKYNTQVWHDTLDTLTMKTTSRKHGQSTMTEPAEYSRS